MAVRKIQQFQGQYRVTIPRAIAQAMGLKRGQAVEWRVAGTNKLEIHIRK